MSSLPVLSAVFGVFGASCLFSISGCLIRQAFPVFLLFLGCLSFLVRLISLVRLSFPPARSVCSVWITAALVLSSYLGPLSAGAEQSLTQIA